MRPAPARAAAALAAVLTAAALSACGDSSASGRTGATSASPSASAPTDRQTPEPPCRDTTPEERGHRLLRALPDSWRRSGATVEFAPAQAGVMGETTMRGALVVRIYVRPCAEQTDALLRHVIAHELGHAWDRARMTDAKRAAYLAARRIETDTPWIGCLGCPDFATPAGDFAETYAQWLRGSHENRSELAPPATAEQLADLAARFFE